jgi:Protein of unknown function (DUF3768)
MTATVAALPEDVRTRLVSAVQSFADFNQENDPHGEHDFGVMEIEGQTYFWKIDYYAPDLRSGVENAALPDTVRVLTIMRADDY